MSDDKTGELRRIYAAWPPERLVRAAFVEADQYSPDAVAVMRQTLNERGVSSAEIASVLTTLEQRDDEGSRLEGVRGWLLVFVVWSGTVSATGVVGGLLLLAGGDGYVRILGAAALAVSGYGAYCSYLLSRVHPSAPSHARRWLVGLMAYSLSAMAVAALTYPGAAGGSARFMIFAPLWLVYLSNSKRVASVYGSRQP